MTAMSSANHAPSVIYHLEDDTNIRDLTIYALTQAGYEAKGFSHAAPFFEACKQSPPDLVLLDIMLPDIDGLEVLRRLRSDPSSASMPIILLSAKGTEYEKVVGLNVGADDYLAKPFGMMELIARVGALLRRSAAPSSAGLRHKLTAGSLELSALLRSVSVQGRPVQLTRKEFDLLQTLMRHKGQVFTRAQLMAEVWGTDFLGGTRTVDVHVQTLRQKLASIDPQSASLIETVRGVGYRFKDMRGD